MTKLKNNKAFRILCFLAVFGFSIGLFNNYRQLWMSNNNLDPITISRIIGIASFVTVLILFFFTLKVSTNKLKQGITISLILKMITSTILVCLNNSNHSFIIKFIMFFDIAFTELILSSIYPFMMNIAKNDVLYTKKEVVESLFSKLGFLVASILVGKIIGDKVLDYNTCFLLSIVFNFLAFIIFISINIESKSAAKELNLREAFKYFTNNKAFILFIVTNLIGSIVWGSIIGMPLLTLTDNLGFNPTTASYIVLGLGIISNILAMLIVRYFRFKNDHLNMIFKYGLRLILYILVLLIGTKEVFIITLVYLLLSDCTYNFIFSGYFINKVDESYSLLLVVLKYCSALLGNGIGIIICGLLFNLENKYLVIPAIILGIIHYILGTILITKKD